MGHDMHFLSRLERLSEAQISLALSLYRNTPLVKALLGRMAPEGSTRVALALADEGPASHVLVERNGAFVTCLAPGMPHDLPVISRAAIDRARRDDEAVRLEFAAAEKLQDGVAELSENVLKLGEGPRVAREHIHEIMGWAPALSSLMYEFHIEALTRHAISWTEVKTPEALKPRHDAHVRRAWRRAWEVGHLLGPSSFCLRHPYGETLPDEPPHYKVAPVSVGAVTWLEGPLLRAAWAITSLGDVVFDQAESAYMTGSEATTSFSGALLLATIGQRWPAFRARARAALDRESETFPSQDDDDRALTDRLRAVVADPRAALERHLERSTALLAARLGPVDDLPARTVMAASLYEELPLKRSGGFLAVLDALPFVAASEYEDLYLPADVLARFPPEDPDGDARRYVEARRTALHAVARPQPARRADAPGRNDPCHCGSGKKFKKCHGA